MKTVENLVPQVKDGMMHTTSAAVQQQQMKLSQEIIPAVPGEYYSYSSVFTDERPLYVLMKCKSNKARMLCEAPGLGAEVNAYFQCDIENPRILSVKAARALGLLDAMHAADTGSDIWFAPTSYTAEQFQDLRASKSTEKLVTVCRLALDNREVVTELHEGLVVALMTDQGKYGLFLVREITPSLIWIEACHVLL